MIKKKIKLSIIIPSFNGQKFLKDTLDSLNFNKYHNVELILVDDASTDNTFLIMKAFKDSFPKKNITILRNKKNLGLARSRRKGIKFAKGQYCIQFDSDDLMYKNTIDIFLKKLEKQRYDFIFSDYDYISEKYKYHNKLTNNNECEHYEYNNYLGFHAPFLYNPISIWRYVVKTSLAKKVYKNINVFYDFGEDKVFLSTLFTLSTKIAYIPNKLILYRKRKNSMTDVSKFTNQTVSELIKVEKYVCDLWGGKNKLPAKIHLYLGYKHIRSRFVAFKNISKLNTKLQYIEFIDLYKNFDFDKTYSDIKTIFPKFNKIISKKERVL